MEVFACVSTAQYNLSKPQRGLNRKRQWRCSHAPPRPSRALRNPIGSSTEGDSGGVRMRLPCPVQRFVAP
eukprot:5840652-Pyramimonas_sp.AAC.1